MSGVAYLPGNWKIQIPNVRLRSDAGRRLECSGRAGFELESLLELR
jgi:hypothetical protein